MEDNIYNKYYYQMLGELEYICDSEIKTFAHCLLDSIPLYFFSVPASSSGKYHPKNDLGEGGLVRHSISVHRMLEHLFVLGVYSDFTIKERDLLRVASLFHDCMKSGSQNDYVSDSKTKLTHPVLAANHIILTAIVNGFDYHQAKYIAEAVITHMGQWNTSIHESGCLPVPETPAQKIIHMADYLASRKDINIVLTDEDKDKTDTNTFVVI